MNHINNIADMTDAILQLVSSEGYLPMNLADMMQVMTLEPGDFGLLSDAVDLLCGAGELVTTKHGKIASAASVGRITGTYRATSHNYGFFSPDNGGEDMFIAAENSLGAMNGDRVQARRIKSDSRGAEGEITLIIERAQTELIGSFHIDELRERLPRKNRHTKKGARLPNPPTKLIAYVTPDDPKLRLQVNIPPSMRNGARDGDKVLVKITRYPESDRLGRFGDAVGKVLPVFGNAESKVANYESILYANRIRTEFGDDALIEAKQVASLPIVPDGRLDLRDKTIFTIDGADAKDFDDAISVERRNDGYLLGVHIADVSYYVKQGGALDNEAFERGMSVYFTDKVVPMLPEELSCGSCSLNRDSDKYALSALISLDSDGGIVEVSLHESIISSKMRGVYSEMNSLITEPDGEFRDKYSFLFPDTLPLLLEVYEKLKRRSDARGSLDLETAESGFILDRDGMPVDVVLRERGAAERMIEQFMLCANEAVASWLNTMGIPCVYRIHEEPSPEKIQNFSMFAYNLGLDITPLRRRKIMPGAYREVMAEAKEKGLDSVLTTVMLRSLMKARYSAVASPHFGLGCELYCHFTSPIRRYPDLAVHRIIRALLQGRLDIDKMESFAERAADKSNENELRVMNAEREIEDLYKILWLEGHVGEEFDAVISSVTSFGFFVELANTCEGLVPIGSLDGYFEYDEKSLTLTCGRTVYHLGDRVRVRLVSCDRVTRKADFELAE